MAGLGAALGFELGGGLHVPPSFKSACRGGLSLPMEPEEEEAVSPIDELGGGS